AAILLLTVLLSVVPLGRGSISPKSWDTHNGAGGPPFRSHSPRMGRTKPRVVVREGSAARLPCVVHHLGDRSVTWMRMRDLHILTAGQLTYSADD
ncbi:Immunoglobulin-like domain, partial [Trinorchestia longiramus]